MRAYAWRQMVSVLLPGLYVCRRKARLSQVELARRVELRPETICRLEKQTQAAGLATIRNLAVVLRVSAEYLTSGVDPIQVAREARRALRQRGERKCKDCGHVKPVAAFIRIRSTAAGYYGRCRECRARRARERYQADPQVREREKSRMRRTRARQRVTANVG